MEVVRLDNISHFRDDMFMPADIFLLQVRTNRIYFGLYYFVVPNLCPACSDELRDIYNNEFVLLVFRFVAE